MLKVEIPFGKTKMFPFKCIFKKLAANYPLPWTHRKLYIPFGTERGAHKAGQKLRPVKKSKTDVQWGCAKVADWKDGKLLGLIV